MVDHDTTSIPLNDAIEIDVPLRASHAATVRLLVASLGADAGFSVDEIDDLKLAVSEVFTLLTETAPRESQHRAHLSLLIDDTSFVIELGNDRASAPIELDPLASAILSSVTDEHDVGQARVRLVKRLTESAR